MSLRVLHSFVFPTLVVVGSCGMLSGCANVSAQDAASRLPPGTVLAYAGNAVPAGFLSANGDVLDPAVNADLCKAIAGLYSLRDEPRNTCRLPDLRARMVIGAGRGTDAESNVNREIGQRLGASTLRLSVNQMPSHAHVVPGSLHVGNNESYPAGGAYSTGDVRYKNTEGGMRSGPDIPVIYDRTGYYTTRTPDQDKADPIDTLPPSLVLMYIIKS